MWTKKTSRQTGLYTTKNYFVSHGVGVTASAMYYFGDVDNEGVAFNGGFNLDNPMASIKHVRRKVYVRVGDLQKKNPDAKESYLDLKRELIEELGVTPQTTYLYIQGDREMEIRRQSVHSTQMRNELSCYSHSTQDIAQMLKKNMGYLVSDPFRQILSDVQMFFTRKSQGTESTPTP